MSWNGKMVIAFPLEDEDVGSSLKKIFNELEETVNMSLI
jgi:hypothetical protein